MEDLKYDQLVDQALAASEAYYSGKEPLMDDAAYDSLVKTIERLEQTLDSVRSDSPTQKVMGAGGDVTHTSPMLSLDNVFTDDDLKKWAENLGGNTWIVEPKLDGLSMSLTYRDGRLSSVATRGDGKTGESVEVSKLDVVHSISQKGVVEVRGEVILTHEGLAVANQIRLDNNEPAFANARNGVAGIMRSIHKTYKIPVVFVGYDLIIDGKRELGQWQLLNHLKQLGFTTTLDVAWKARKVTTENLVKTVKDLGDQRGSLGFDADGAVIKTADPKVVKSAGVTSRAPRWAIAYKYPADTRYTTLVEVQWQVGRTGVITPRGKVEPVEVGGATVTYATLHNPDDMLKKGFMVGDTVTVYRAGEVVPRIEAPVISKRTGKEQPISVPKVCPRCGSAIDKSSVRWRCTNATACAAKEKVEYAASRKAFDIEGLGNVLAQKLADSGRALDAGDIFSLTLDDLQQFEGMGELSASKVIENIQAAKTKGLEKVLTALGMRVLGATLSARIAAKVPDWDTLLTWDEDDFKDVEGIGELNAATIQAELVGVVPVVEKMRLAGVDLTSHSFSTEPNTGVWAGKKVCVTGSIEGYTRESIHEYIKQLGGTPVSSVSKNTDILIASSTTSTKAKKAEALGVQVITPDNIP